MIADLIVETVILAIAELFSTRKGACIGVLLVVAIVIAVVLMTAS